MLRLNTQLFCLVEPDWRGYWRPTGGCWRPTGRCWRLTGEVSGDRLERLVATSEQSMSPLTEVIYVSDIWLDRTGIILRFGPKYRVIYIVFYQVHLASAVRK